MSFIGISYLELLGPFCSVEQNICAILVKGIMRNNSVLDLWFRRRCHFKDFLSGALAAHVFCGAKPFMQFW